MRRGAWLVVIQSVLLGLTATACAWAHRASPPLPATYAAACASSGVCLPGGPAGAIPRVLDRPLRIPALRAGQACPTTAGHDASNSYFVGVALGTGPVRPLIAMRGDLRHGVIDVAAHEYPGWLAFKTLWFSVPRYDGPVFIRAASLDPRGRIGFDTPLGAPSLVVPPGPTLNTGPNGYRTIPNETLVKRPGCYAWQVDGLDFSEVIVFRAVPLRTTGG